MVMFPKLPAELIILLYQSSTEGLGQGGPSLMHMSIGATKAVLRMLIYGQTGKHQNGFIKKADTNWWKFEKQAELFGIENNEYRL